jgi:hypothetical protein
LGMAAVPGVVSVDREIAAGAGLGDPVARADPVVPAAETVSPAPATLAGVGSDHEEVGVGLAVVDSDPRMALGPPMASDPPMDSDRRMALDRQDLCQATLGRWQTAEGRWQPAKEKLRRIRRRRLQRPDQGRTGPREELFRAFRLGLPTRRRKLRHPRPLQPLASQPLASRPLASSAYHQSEAPQAADPQGLADGTTPSHRPCPIFRPLWPTRRSPPSSSKRRSPLSAPPARRPGPSSRRPKRS